MKNLFVFLGGFILILSCHKAVNDLISFPLSYEGANPGSVDLNITSLGGSAANLVYNITGGTPNLPIVCSFAIYDYASDPNSLINSLYIYDSLDDNGTADLTVENTLCSFGATEQSYIVWDCAVSAPPFQALTASNVGGNAFFFNCP